MEFTLLASLWRQSRIADRFDEYEVGAPYRIRSIRPKIAVAILIFLAAGAVAWYQLARPTAAATTVLAYGAIDVRQAQLAFNDNDRIARILVQEGDRVKKASFWRSSTRRGCKRTWTRPWATPARRASTSPAWKTAAGRRKSPKRARPSPPPKRRRRTTASISIAMKKMARLDVATKQARDHAEAALKVATANRESAEQALKLAVEGPRWEDVKAAEAQLQSAEGALALARRQLADARLYAPADGVIEDRILEPGDMAKPPLFTACARSIRTGSTATHSATCGDGTGGVAAIVKWTRAVGPLDAVS
jgi:membrane fusion protein YbhG